MQNTQTHSQHHNWPCNGFVIHHTCMWLEAEASKLHKHANDFFKITEVFFTSVHRGRSKCDHWLFGHKMRNILIKCYRRTSVGLIHQPVLTRNVFFKHTYVVLKKCVLGICSYVRTEYTHNEDNCYGHLTTEMCVKNNLVLYFSFNSTVVTYNLNYHSIFFSAYYTFLSMEMLNRTYTQNIWSILQNIRLFKLFLYTLVS